MAHASQAASLRARPGPLSSSSSSLAADFRPAVRAMASGSKSAPVKDEPVKAASKDSPKEAAPGSESGEKKKTAKAEAAR
jgi:hypothetical protein